MSPEQLFEHLNTLSAGMQIMQQQIRDLTAQNTELRNQSPNPSSTTTSTPLETQIAALVEHLRISNLTPTTSVSNPDPPRVKSERHPDPKPFEGDAKDLDRFTSQLYNKLKMNADRYPTEEERVGYAFSRLDGTAATAMEGFWSQGSCSIHSIVDFTAHLERLYGNPNKREHAANQWLVLRQGNREFTDFLSEFERLAAVGKIDDSVQKRRQLGLAIGDKLRYRMVTLDSVPEDYVSFRDKCIQIESRLSEANVLSAISKAHTNTGTRAPTGNTRSAHLPPAHGTTKTPFVSSTYRAPPAPPASPATGANATPVVERTTTQGGNLMDLSRNRGPLTPEEKQRRRDNNLCLYCAGPGHIARECPSRISRIAEMELVDYPDNSQSGKE
jgi:hypothetical protein